MRVQRASLAGATALALVFASSSGCLTVGENFSSAPVTKIEKGVSSKKDIRRLFGDPFRTGLDNGYESWTYVYNRLAVFGKASSKDLYVVFNKDGTVRAYTFNSNIDRIPEEAELE